MNTPTTLQTTPWTNSPAARDRLKESSHLRNNRRRQWAQNQEVARITAERPLFGSVSCEGCYEDAD